MAADSLSLHCPRALLSLRYPSPILARPECLPGCQDAHSYDASHQSVCITLTGDYLSTSSCAWMLPLFHSDHPGIDRLSHLSSLAQLYFAVQLCRKPAKSIDHSHLISLLEIPCFPCQVNPKARKPNTFYGSYTAASDTLAAHSG